MFVLVVLKIVIDAFLLHEPTDKVEICLPVLDAVLPGSVLPAEGIFDICKAVLLAYCLDDVRGCFFLEDTAIGRAGEKP